MNNIIKNALIKSLNYEFNIPIYAEETFNHNEENCFFVEVVEVEEKRMLNNYRERVLSFSIKYLPEKDDLQREEFLVVADKLYEILDIIGDEEKFLAVSLAHKIEDDMLVFSAMYKVRLLLKDNSDLMERLEKNERVLG